MLALQFSTYDTCLFTFQTIVSRRFKRLKLNYEREVVAGVRPPRSAGATPHHIQPLFLSLSLSLSLLTSAARNFSLAVSLTLPPPSSLTQTRLGGGGGGLLSVAGVTTHLKSNPSDEYEHIV